MIDLLTSLKSAVTELLTGETFSDPAGPAREMRCYAGTMPPKRTDAEMGEDAPCCIITAPDFTIAKEATTHAVTMDFILYAPDSHTHGIEEQDRLLTLLKPLATKRLAPHKLEGNITGTLPEAKHPFYMLRLQMDYRSLTNPHYC